MLLSFRLANFKSFRDEQAFSFVRGSYTTPVDETSEEGGKRPWDQRVGTIAGLYGSNASGKSNVLKALAFMRNAVRDSFQNWSPGSAIPTEPFKLDPMYKDEPSLRVIHASLQKCRPITAEIVVVNVSIGRRESVCMIRQVLKFAMTLSIIARILLTCLLNSFSQLRSSRSCGFLIGVIIPLPTYPLSAIQSAGSKVRRTPDSLRQWLSCRLPSMGSEIHASFSARVQATWTFRPVVLCLPEYSSG